MERELSQKEVLLSGINQNEEFKIDINNQKIGLEKQIENPIYDKLFELLIGFFLEICFHR